MSLHLSDERIPEEQLAEQWYSLLHKVIAGLQSVYRGTGLKQKTIAKRLGKSPEVVSRCLSGQKNMTLRTMHDLARAMDCRLDVIVTPLSSLKITNRSALVQKPPRVELEKDNKATASTVFNYPVIDLNKQRELELEDA